jgi:hypothetical protein
MIPLIITPTPSPSKLICPKPPSIKMDPGPLDQLHADSAARSGSLMAVAYMPCDDRVLVQKPKSLYMRTSLASPRCSERPQKPTSKTCHLCCGCFQDACCYVSSALHCFLLARRFLLSRLFSFAVEPFSPLQFLSPSSHLIYRRTPSHNRAPFEVAHSSLLNFPHCRTPLPLGLFIPSQTKPFPHCDLGRS